MMCATIPAVEAVERSHVYGLLSTVFRRPLDAGGLERIRAPEMLSALAAAGVDPGEDFATRDSAELLDALAVEFTHVFHTPGHVSPFESIIADGGDELRGAAFSDVRHFMGDIGYEVPPDSGEMADHISVELAFMADLCARQAEAIANGDQETADFVKCMQEKFLVMHLGRWATHLATAINARATQPFYAETASFLADFVDGERTVVAA
jgi:TorA maturation chaperone TorD